MAIGRASIAAIRWGYGFRAGETPPDGPEALLAQLSAPDPMREDFPLMDILGAIRTRREARAAERDGRADQPGMTDSQRAMAEARRPLLRRRIETPVLSPQGFRERLVTFWADHFTVRAAGPMLSLLSPHHVENAIRPHIAGRFEDLLIAAETHPGMLVFLNQNDSIGPNSVAGKGAERGLNENLAREILELHTLGVKSAYTQGDVRQFAELLTGYTMTLEEGTVFRANRAEPGAETVLGKPYGSDRPSPEDAASFLRDLAVHPETARHIAGKLVTHFVTDEPDPAHVAAVEAAWRDTGGDLMAVYAALLGHPAAWAPMFAKARQPFDFLIALLRACGAGAEGPLQDMDRVAARSMKHLQDMGQKLLDPPGPNGWPEEAEAWITPQGLAARVEVVQFHARLLESRTDPRDFVAGALGEIAEGPLAFAVAAAEQRWEGIALALLSPEFNRR